MSWAVTPPVRKTPTIVRKLLSNGYVDMSKWDSWVWQFEVSQISECVEHATLKTRNDVSIDYCSEAYISFSDVSNQYLVLVRRRTNAVLNNGVRFKHRYQVVAFVPRFMGLLKYPESSILFIIIDGNIKVAYRIPKHTPAVVASIINMDLQPPFFVRRNTVAMNILYLSIPVVDFGVLINKQVEQL